MSEIERKLLGEKRSVRRNTNLKERKDNVAVNA